MTRPTFSITVVALLAALLPLRAGGHPSHALPSLEAHSTPALAAPRLLEGLGEYHFPITSDVPAARRYFDQGMILAWGFNSAEAERSFREASRLDPNCAMCRWGIAYALGPSINHDLDEAAAKIAYEAVREARALSRNAGERERALIGALAKRYSAHPTASRSTLDAAYAAAMRAVAQQFARDADVLTLYAEALMTPRGRDYWRRDGTPQPWTPRIVSILERALRLFPDHPGANHYYVHALEDAPDLSRALPSAERLARIAPGAGHLVHMSAHVYFGLGRYAAAALANEKAIAADRQYPGRQRRESDIHHGLRGP